MQRTITTSFILFLLPAFLVMNIPAPAFAESGKMDNMPDINAITTLDLDTASQIALMENPSLDAAAQRVEQAAQIVKQARGSYWPELTAGASANRTRQSDKQHRNNLASATALNPFADLDNPENYFTTELTTNWTFFDGFRRHFTYAAAKYGEEQSKSALLDSRRLLLSAVAGSFYKAQLANERIAIAAADEAFNLKQLSDARARQIVGTGSLSAVLNFEIQANAAKYNKIRAMQEYRTAMNGLATLMGIPGARLPEGLRLTPLKEETTTIMQQPDASRQTAYAHKHRPDIITKAKGVEQAEAEIGSARATYYPSVSLSGSIKGERSENGSFEQDDFARSVGILFNYTLFSGGTDRARVAEAAHKKKERLKNLESLKISVTKEVNDALSELDAARQQLELQRKNASLVKRNRDLVEKEYAAGKASLVRLNEAQRNLIQAQSSLATARLSLRYAWANLYAATAENLEHCKSSGEVQAFRR